MKSTVHTYDSVFNGTTRVIEAPRCAGYSRCWISTLVDVKNVKKRTVEYFMLYCFTASRPSRQTNEHTPSVRGGKRKVYHKTDAFYK